MVSNLLEMAQLQASEMTLKRRCFTLAMCHRHYRSVYSPAELGERNLKWRTQPGQVIRADRQLVTELLAILLENAFKIY